MPLSPFTPAGVEEKLKEMYALPDSQLSVEAVKIRNNFKKWMRDNFAFSANQANYLSNIDDIAADYFGQQCAFCFSNRLEISLSYPEPPQTLGYSKWTATSNDILVQADGNGQSTVSGGLVFSLTYVV